MPRRRARFRCSTETGLLFLPDVPETFRTFCRIQLLVFELGRRSSCVCTNDRTGFVIEGTKLRLFRGKELLYKDEVSALPEAYVKRKLLAAGDFKDLRKKVVEKSLIVIDRIARGDKK